MIIHDNRQKLDLLTGTVISKQYIPDSFLDDISDLRTQSNRPAGDWHLAARVPVEVHEQWLREGYDCTKEPIRKTLARLSALDMGKFIATNKNL